MKFLSIISFLCLLGPLATAQQEGRFFVQVSKDSVRAEEPVVISFHIEGMDYHNFKKPQWEGLTLINGPAQSTSIQYVNGKMSRESVYQYTLTAFKQGVYEIPPATIVVGERELKTEAVRIVVTSDSDRPAPETPSEKPKRPKKTIKTIRT